MASEIIATFPADAYLHTHEVWACLLGLSRLDLGQLGLLHLHSIHDHLRVSSNRRSLEFILRRSLHQSEHGVGRLWCGQRIFRSSEPTAPRLGNVALADGAEKESWHYSRFCHGNTVGAPVPSPLLVPAVKIHSEHRD